MASFCFCPNFGQTRVDGVGGFVGSGSGQGSVAGGGAGSLIFVGSPMNVLVKAFMKSVRSSFELAFPQFCLPFPQPLAPKRTNAAPVNKSRRGMVMFAAPGSARGAATFWIRSSWIESLFFVVIATPFCCYSLFRVGCFCD